MKKNIKVGILIIAILVGFVMIYLLTSSTNNYAFNTDKHDSETTKIINTCKQYLSEHNFVYSGEIDYDYYNKRMTTNDEIKEAVLDKGYTVRNKNNYEIIIVGDTSASDGIHNYASLIREKETGTICGYIPTK